jgi:hypothetical protein
VWFGSCSLAIQYWGIYSIINEQGRSISEVWDGENLKLTFQMTVDREGMSHWNELQEIARSVELSEEEDAILWQYIFSGKYSVQSLYAIVSDRGVRQIYTLVIWKVLVPPRIHIFMWLLANNKVLTRDNLAKRRHLDDMTCLFCEEGESACHLFFECCVASAMWDVIANVTGYPKITDLLTMGKYWVLGKIILHLMCVLHLLSGHFGSTGITCAFKENAGETWRP